MFAGNFYFIFKKIYTGYHSMSKPSLSAIAFTYDHHLYNIFLNNFFILKDENWNYVGEKRNNKKLKTVNLSLISPFIEFILNFKFYNFIKFI